METREELNTAAPPWAERIVRFLDDGLVVPGTNFRIGFDGILGLLFPAAGDALTAVGSLSLFYLALQRGVPRVVLLRMLANVGLDALVGSVPVLGDLFDFGFKANRKNLRLIERSERGERARSAGDYLFLALLGVVALSALALPFILTGLLIAYLNK